MLFAAQMLSSAEDACQAYVSKQKGMPPSSYADRAGGNLTHVRTTWAGLFTRFANVPDEVVSF